MTFFIQVNHIKTLTSTLPYILSNAPINVSEREQKDKFIHPLPHPQK